MSTKNKIIYWIATGWLALGMLSTGIVQLSATEQEIRNIRQLGFPAYLLALLGIWKLLGVVAVLAPKFPLVELV
ncbi:DoxX family protein [Spirosoma spitsbergense]|uniref:DoxX family protein n=1 Tax=Spirosoma spitsbergense TaxID=431554 RepID=UPI00037284DF|nr:DoxX family protein [Spirosoma spitsbergense]